MHLPTFNITCVCCVNVSYILMLILQRWRDMLKNIYISFKRQKITKFCTFVWYKIICYSNTTILVTIGG